MSFLYYWWYGTQENGNLSEKKISALEIKHAMDKLNRIPEDRKREKYLPPLAKEFQQKLDDGVFIPWDAELSKKSDIMYRMMQQHNQHTGTKFGDIKEHHRRKIPVLLALQEKTRLQ